MSGRAEWDAVIESRRGADVSEQSPTGTEDVLDEARSLTTSTRQNAYGHPLDDYTKVGRIWGAILGLPDIPAETACLMMQAVKISREANAHKRDNIVDGAGYWRCVQLIHDERERREGVSP